jgi:hypothetical protein
LVPSRTVRFRRRRWSIRDRSILKSPRFEAVGRRQLKATHGQMASSSGGSAETCFCLQGGPTMGNAKNGSAAMRAPSRPRSLLLSIISPVLICKLTWASLSHAQVPASAYCVLDRSPVILEASLPSELACKFDQDGNGLDDEIERQLAKCVAPEIRFDSAETDLRPGEPNALFTAYRTAPTQIVIKYSMLMLHDGGFVLDDDAHCEEIGPIGFDDAHWGDAQPVSVTVSFERGASAWLAHVTSLGAADGMLTLNGTRPVLYATAGKHHWETAPIDTCFPVGGTGLCCRDRADGNGPTRIPGESPHSAIGHVPAQIFFRWENAGSSDFPATFPRYQQANVCARAADPSSLLPLEGFQKFSLSDFGIGYPTLPGYPPPNYLAPFYAADAPIAHLAVDFDRDIDGDGRPESFSLVRTDPEEFEAVEGGTDLCPWGEAEDDHDEDRLFGECDPDPTYRSTYVAGGSDRWRAFGEAPRTGWNWFTPRGGFWDSDGDGWVEGEDLCPTVTGGGAVRWPSTNNWNFSVGEQALFSDDPGHRDPGRFYRGNVCDPYPATQTTWLEVGQAERTTMCYLGPRYETAGADDYVFQVGLVAGRSANDPQRDEPIVREFLVQPFRCSCDGPTCLDDVNSPCFSGTLQEAEANTPAGAGWRPVHRKNCLVGASTYCEPMVIEVTNPSRSVNPKVTWEWVAEYEQYPEHFPEGSVGRSRCAAGVVTSQGWRA